MAFPDYFTEPQQPLGTVYVVDDDEAVCDSVRWLLEAGNYKVEIFDSGESFIAKYDPQAIAVLLLDVRMSGMSGLEVQEHLIARKADLRRRSLNEREAAGRQKLAKLTPRERQVLERIVAGRLNKQIADDLGISIKTVEAHRASIMDKTASGTVADLMRVVMDSGERL